MKTSKDFFDRIRNDEAFAKEVAEKAQKIAEEGQQDYIEL